MQFEKKRISSLKNWAVNQKLKEKATEGSVDFNI
jgi:hypothetical protein